MSSRMASTHPWDKLSLEWCASHLRTVCSITYSRIIQSIQAKSSTPSLPRLVSLAVLPFTILEASDPAYQASLQHFFAHVLTIPLLPNRLPIASLSFLAPRIPLPSLHVDSAPQIRDLIASDLDRIHLLANLAAFAPPRYTTLPPSAISAYLHLTAEVMNVLPTNALEPPQRNAPVSVQNAWDSDDSDVESTPQVEVVSSFAPRRVLPELDAKTRQRLQTLPSQPHLHALLNAAHKHSSSEVRTALFSWLHALSSIWPTRRDKITGNVVAWSGGGLVRDLYRSYVRSSPLGNSSNLAGTYHHAPFLTMTDDFV